MMKHEAAATTEASDSVSFIQYRLCHRIVGVAVIVIAVDIR